MEIRIKHIIFDFDHTLAYRDGMWSFTIEQILHENGHPEINIEDIRRFVKDGFPWDFYELSHEELFKGKAWWNFLEEFVVRILVGNNIKQTEAEHLSTFVRERYLDTSYWYLYPESIDVLKQCKAKGYQCHILSNHTPELPDLINYLGLNDYFEKLFNSAEIGYEKPNKRIYEYVLSKLDAEPCEALMIGDNFISDVSGARSNGIPAIWINRTGAFQKYTLQVKELKEVIPMVNQISSI